MSLSAFQTATDVFVHGYAFTRSFTHPYVATRLSASADETVWALRDAPRVRGAYRIEEVVATGIAVDDLDALACKQTRHAFRVSYLLPHGVPDTPLRAGFKRLGYRLMATETLMRHALGTLAAVPLPYPIERVTTEPQAERLARMARRRQILPEHLTADPAPMRQYVALDGLSPVGRVGSVVVGEYRWCTNMFVEPGYRRLGIARSLLVRLLTEDRESGARANILLASHTGTKLYEAVGYEPLGTLYLYSPPKVRVREAVDNVAACG